MHNKEGTKERKKERKKKMFLPKLLLCIMLATLAYELFIIYEEKVVEVWKKIKDYIVYCIMS